MSLVWITLGRKQIEGAFVTSEHRHGETRADRMPQPRNIVNSEWPGVMDTEALEAGHFKQVDRLADAAKAGNWTEVFRLLGSSRRLSVNQWRIGGKSWFTPLHQAAWLGASADVVRQLIRLGAWPSLRNADGDRAVDIAAKLGHHHLLEPLAVREPKENDLRKFGAWDRHLAELIAERTRTLRPVEYRRVPTEVVEVEQLESLWFGYPGMYGGFAVSISRSRLFVESWSRIVGGSRQAHVITEEGCALVEAGSVETYVW